MKLRADRREIRRTEAAERTEDRSKRSAADQIRRLDIRLGTNLGAMKERTKLLMS